MLTQTSFFSAWLWSLPVRPWYHAVPPPCILLQSFQPSSESKTYPQVQMRHIFSLCSRCVSCAVQGCDGRRAKRFKMQPLKHRPLNPPSRASTSKTSNTGQKTYRSPLGHMKTSIRQKKKKTQWGLVEASAGLRRRSHPHGSVIYHTADTHGSPGAPRKTHSWHWTFLFNYSSLEQCSSLL